MSSPIRLLSVVRLRFRSLVRRNQVERDLRREIDFHLEQHIAESMARGKSLETARTDALRAFGGRAQIEEEVRDARGVIVVENLLRDFRYAIRGLARQPLLVLAAGTSIALGVVANATVFSISRELLFAKPSAHAPEQLAQLRIGGGSHVAYQRWRDLNQSAAVAGVAGFRFEGEVNWRHGDDNVTITPLLATANFFDLLGAPIAQGRAFTATEAAAEHDPRVVVISHGFWQRRLGGDAHILGQSLLFNGESFTVIGVLPKDLRAITGFGLAPEVYLPLGPGIVPDLRNPDAKVVQLVIRLKPGQSLQQGRAAIEVEASRLGRLYGDSLFGRVERFTPVGAATQMRELPVVGTFMGLLFVVAVLVLLIGCANVTGLLLARSSVRRREIAIRLAIGAGRGRLLQQLMTEGFCLALIGTALGLAVTLAAMPLLNGVSLPVGLPVELHLSVDRPWLGCALALLVAVTLLSALIPAIQATRLSLVSALKQDDPHYGGRRFGLRGILVAGQVTVSIVLLVTAGLFLRNLAAARAVDPGFEVAHTLVAEVSLAVGEPSLQAGESFLRAAAERVGAMQGVSAVSYSDAVPLTLNSGRTTMTSIGVPGRAERVDVRYEESFVGPRYFAALGMPLRRGREFLASDGSGSSSPVVLVNEEFRRRYLSGQDPIGQILTLPGEKGDVASEVIGMVATAKYRTLGEEPQAAIYRPFQLRPANHRLSFLLIHVAADDAETMRPAISRVIAEVDPRVAVSVQSMQSSLAFAFLPSRIGALVLGSLGVTGLLLAMIGLYAVVAYSVSRRTGELAVRMALGASRQGILRLVLRDAAVLVAAGLSLGLCLSLSGSRLLAPFLVSGMSVIDPVSFSGMAAVLLVVSLLASWIPAWFGTAIDPALAMRLE